LAVVVLVIAADEANPVDFWAHYNNIDMLTYLLTLVVAIVT